MLPRRTSRRTRADLSQGARVIITQANLLNAWIVDPANQALRNPEMYRIAQGVLRQLKDVATQRRPSTKSTNDHTKAQNVIDTWNISRQNADIHNRTDSVLFRRFPGEVRNIIYKNLINAFQNTWRYPQALRTGAGPNNANHQSIQVPDIRATRGVRLILTPPGAGARNMTPGLAVMNKNDYAQFKRDLIALGQVCQLFRQEFRCQQRNSMTPFVRIEESDAFSRIFYHPSLLNSNETMADFEGRPLTIIFPIGNDDPNDNSPRRRHDVLPLLKFMRDATQIQTRLWAHQVGQPLNDLFGSGGTFPTYLGTPDALRLRKVEYRPRAQHVPTIPGIFDEPYIGVFFETTNTADSVKWVNGWKWTWVDLTASRVTRSSQQLIPHPQKYQRWDFLNATGLNVAEIENSNWRVEFQVGEDKTSRTARKL